MSGRSVWQVGGGPSGRSYVNVFLKHGVALIGPGDPGPWSKERDDSHYGAGYVRRFASELNEGDIVLLRGGQATVRAIGLVHGEYQYLPQFDDVNGWDLQHARRIRWNELVEPYDFGRAVFGANPAPATRVLEPCVVDYARRLVESPPHDWQTRALPPLPVEEPLLEHPPEEIADIVARANDLGPLYWDRTAFGDHPTEDELVAHFVVPLLSRLGWTEEHIAVKWRRVDVALFSTLPRVPDNCHFIIEAKRLGAGVEGALRQAKDYLDALDVRRDIVVTDGLRYRLYAADQDFEPCAYANLTRLKGSGLPLFDRIRRP